MEQNLQPQHRELVSFN